jgi:RNA polymerase sigma factor (sigma-70 family)
MTRTNLNQRFGAVLSLLRQDPRSDAELLTRFLTDRDESAFEALLVRHTPAVRAACRTWLRSLADIDDAAQATFLVLVQRAGSIRDREALGSWLYRVAANVARRLQQQQKPLASLPDVPGRVVAERDDIEDVLAEEVARLPEKYRLPVQLCYWAGLTTAEAAARLGWPRGTVLTRLAWARNRLQRCLTRRGVESAVLAGAAATVPAVHADWVRVTARTAKGLLAGGWPASLAISDRTVSLTKGVVRAMMMERAKYIFWAALVAVALVGFGIHHWVSASGSTPERVPAASSIPGDKEPAKAEAAETHEAPRRRREAVIRLPVGTFVKEVDASPYGKGRLTWTYEEDRVLGLIEVSALGGELELATEAEYSLSRHGTIYGILTGVQINRLQLPEMKELEGVKWFAGLWPAVEPLANEVLVDLPFSYRFRVQGDRLIISNFRILLAGPNPLGKLGALTTGEEAFQMLAYFQALGTALEGTYLAADSKEQPRPDKWRMPWKTPQPVQQKRVR